MEKPKILFAMQEIYPYLDESHMSLIGRHLPQGIQERGKEIRTFMPRYGNINERRYQLHEVIRLSGMNLIIDDTDHPLLIKVASIQSARMQVYFIDNEDFFQRKFVLADAKNNYYKDNDERTIFFCRGIIETVKKLGWIPDLIHCHGWISNLLPIYIKKAFRDNPVFSDTKVIYSIYDDDFPNTLGKNFATKLKLPNITDEDLKIYKNASFVNIMKSAIDYCDGIIIGSENINPELEDYLKVVRLNKPVLDYQGTDNYIDAFSEFYNEILVNEPVYIN
jgi:starch synthase